MNFQDKQTCIQQVNDQPISSSLFNVDINAQDVIDLKSELNQNGDQVILSIFYFNNKIGCSYFVSSSSKIFFFSDIQDTCNDFKIIKRIFQQVEPNFVLLSSKCDFRLKNRIVNCLNLLNLNSQSNKSSREESIFGNFFVQDEMQTQSDLSPNVYVLPHHFFNLEDAKKKILQLSLPHFPNVEGQEKYIFISSIINFTDTTMIQSLGALIKYLEMNYHLRLECDKLFFIQSLNYVFIKDFLFIDQSTKEALQIFVNNDHPSVYKQGKARKEGSSLFALFNRCSSRVGSMYLRKIFNQPIRNIKSINKRLDLVEFLLSPMSQNLISILKNNLKNIQDTNLIVTKMNYADLSVNDWNKLYKNANNIILISETLKQVKETFPLFTKIITLVNKSSINNIFGLISEVIDFKESFVSGRVEIKRGLDEELDEMKATFKRLPDILSKSGVEEYLKYQNWINSCAVTYVTQVGYLLCIPLTHEQLLSENFEIPNLELVYRVGNDGFYRSPLTATLDETIGDILTEIYDKQRLYMLQLQLKVIESLTMFEDLINACAKLDCFIAFAETSKELNYIRPCLNQDNIIEIKEGRHPLQELFVKKFVPNSYKCQKNSEKIKIITGPNAAGKTIYLKQICLIVYLAHLGSFVPAKYANISTIDKIFSRIKSNESLSTGLSSFLYDLHQIAFPLREFTDKSLIAIDEFGKATDYVSGLSLLASIIDYFNQNLNPPYLLILTHFHSLSQYLTKVENVSYFTFQVDICEDEAIYYYQLIEGKAESSLSHLLAKSVGIEKKIIDRSIEIKSKLESNSKIDPLYKQSIEKRTQTFLQIFQLFEELDFNSNLDSGIEICVKFLDQIYKLQSLS